MILDNNMVFANALTLTTNSDTASSVFDLATGQMLTGSTYTAATALNLVWGNASVFGEDLGIGDGVGVPKFFTNVSTAITTSNSATLNIQLQGAIDAGGTTISGLTWTTEVETGAIAVANLTLNAVVGKLWWPHRGAGQALPRFIRFNYNLGTGQFTAGAVSTYGLLDRDDWSTKNYPSNFVVAA